MIRITESQYRMFQEQGRALRKSPVARVRRPKEQLPENILESQIKSFLEARGWACTRQHVGTFVPLGRIMKALDAGQVPREIVMRNIVRIGVKGDPDWRASRPLPGVRYGAQMFLWEAKAPGRKPSPEQRARMEALSVTGTLAAWFDDFDGGWDTSFVPWYRERFGE